MVKYQMCLFCFVLFISMTNDNSYVLTIAINCLIFSIMSLDTDTQPLCYPPLLSCPYISLILCLNSLSPTLASSSFCKFLLLQCLELRFYIVLTPCIYAYLSSCSISYLLQVILFSLQFRYATIGAVY